MKECNKLYVNYSNNNNRIITEECDPTKKRIAALQKSIFCTYIEPVTWSEVRRGIYPPPKIND
jgi:hypothetical protein